MKRQLFQALIIVILLVNTGMSTASNYAPYTEEMLLAEDLLKQNKLHQAQAVYVALLSKSPQYTPAMLALGTLYMKQSEFVKAEELFLGVINTSKGNAQAYERLAYNYYLWSNENPESSQVLLKNANKAIKKALEIDKYNAQIYTTLGLLEIENKNYDKALSAFQKALDINPQDADAYVNLGILYTRLNKPELAIKQFERAISLDTKSPRAYKSLGKMLAESRQYRQAIHFIEKGQFYDIYMTYKVHFLLGLMYEKLANHEKAIEEYTKTLKIKPNYVDAFTRMAHLFEIMGEEKKSIEAYRRAIDIDYGIMEQFMTQARNYLRNKDYIHTRPAFTKILKIEPSNQTGFEGLCSYHYLLSRENKMDHKNWYLDKDFLAKNLQEFKADNHEIKVNWQKFLIARQGVTPESRASLEEIAALQPEKPEDYAAKGEALFLLQDYFSASDILKSAIDKYISHYSTEDDYEQASSKLVWLADRLYTYHELFASRAIYDRARKLTGNENAITGLTNIAKTKDRANAMFDDLYKIPKTETYHKQMIDSLQEIINFYPQSAKAHYLLARHYASIKEFKKAIDELKLFIKLQPINPYKNAPGPKKIDKLMEKYSEILDKKHIEEINQQIKEEEKELKKIIDQYYNDLENTDIENIMENEEEESGDLLQ